MPRLPGGVAGSGFDLLDSGSASGVEAGTMGAGVIGEDGAAVSPGMGPSLDLTVRREATGPHDDPREPTWGERPPPVGLCVLTSGVRGAEAPRDPVVEGLPPPLGTPSSGRPRIPRIWSAISPPSLGASGMGLVPVGPAPGDVAAAMLPPPAPVVGPVEPSTLLREALSPGPTEDDCGNVAAVAPMGPSPSP